MPRKPRPGSYMMVQIVRSRVRSSGDLKHVTKPLLGYSIYLGITRQLRNAQQDHASDNFCPAELRRSVGTESVGKR